MGKMKQLWIRIFVCRGRHMTKLDSHGHCYRCWKYVGVGR